MTDLINQNILKRGFLTKNYRLLRRIFRKSTKDEQHCKKVRQNRGSFTAQELTPAKESITSAFSMNLNTSKMQLMTNTLLLIY
jgi:hypothetical protein